MAKKLLNLLEQNDWAEFQKFLKTDVGSVSETEEAEFFKKASEEWKKAYLRTMWPSPRAERRLMVSASPELLRFSYNTWGFFKENLLWVFGRAADDVCYRVLECLTSISDDAVEIAMLQRRNTDMLQEWLDKFGELGEESEKLLNESQELQSMKSFYIDYVIRAQG